MAKMRFAHVVSGFVLTGAFVVRFYWFFRGNFWSRWYAYIPIRRRQWQGIRDMLEFYSFLRFDPGMCVGHNPLAALSYFVVYLLILVEILTGLALYDQVLNNPVLHQLIGWLPLLLALSYLRLIHYSLMFVFFAFVIFHVYASILVSNEEESGLLDSIFSGWKFVPAGDLRQEIRNIPEARSFAKRHQLLPQGTPEEERAGKIPKSQPAPSPMVLYRNWISYAGTGVAGVGVFVFAVLTAYHTIGGGALTEPYGDLVIFFLPPMFVVAGVVIILIGMYVEWIRWRMHKPLSFARYPTMNLNVASERKALLVVAIGAAIISVPAIYGGEQAYLYTDAVSFCGASCHSMTPELRDLSAVAACACRLFTMPRRSGQYWILLSKMRGHDRTCRDRSKRLPEADSGSRGGRCVPCGAIANGVTGRLISSARARCIGRIPCRRAEHALGDRYVGSGRRRRTARGHVTNWKSLACLEQSGVCRERSRLPEYSLGAGRRSKDGNGKGVYHGAANIHHIPHRRDPNHGLRGLS